MLKVTSSDRLLIADVNISGFVNQNVFQVIMLITKLLWTKGIQKRHADTILMYILFSNSMATNG